MPGEIKPSNGIEGKIRESSKGKEPKRKGRPGGK